MSSILALTNNILKKIKVGKTGKYRKFKRNNRSAV
jgi:hypothetical protein